MRRDANRCSLEGGINIDKGQTRAEVIKEIEDRISLNDFHNAMNDLDTIGTNDVRVWLDQDRSFMPDVLPFYCRKCKEFCGFEQYHTNTETFSTYMLWIEINGKPTMIFKKIYRCGCGREFVTTTQVFEQVGYHTEYGYHPINYEEYFKKNDEEESK